MKNIYEKQMIHSKRGEVQGFSCFVLLLSCFTDHTDVLQVKGETKMSTKLQNGHNVELNLNSESHHSVYMDGSQLNMKCI